MNDKEIEKLFVEKNINFKINYYHYNKRKIRYLETGSDSLPVAILIHGAPGSLTGFKDFLLDTALLNHFKIVSVDRPGYGFSGFGKAETSIQEQATILLPIIEKYKKRKKITLLGTSFGGPLAARIAMDYPEMVDQLILVSAPLGPGLEKIYNISYPMRWSLFSWLVPKALMVANKEKLTHKKELEKMSNCWDNICIPVTIIHGDKDNLIYFSNVGYAQKMLRNSKPKIIIVPNKGHFLTWTAPQVIKQAMIESMALIQTDTLKFHLN